MSSGEARLGGRATERTLLVIALIFRAAGVLQLSAWLPDDPAPRWLTLTLVLVVTLESVAVFVAYVRRRAIGPAWLVAGDALFLAGFMILDAALTTDPVTHEWGRWIHSLTLYTMVGIAFGLRTWWAVLLTIMTFAGAYQLCTMLSGFDDPYPIYHIGMYFLGGAGPWLGARFLRPRAAAMDEAHARAAAAEAALERERETAARAALLHDRILQTLEVLSSGHTAIDPEIRKQVAASASWLRVFVQGEHRPSADSLTFALCDVVGDVIRLHGLTVEFHGGQLCAIDSVTPPPIAAAVAGALYEALTNVAKHSGTDRAVVHCEVTEGDLRVSIVDQGRGFDTTVHHHGTGLRLSIRRRIEEIGGHARICSVPREGTQVDLRVPLTQR